MVWIVGDLAADGAGGDGDDGGDLDVIVNGATLRAGTWST